MACHNLARTALGRSCARARVDRARTWRHLLSCTTTNERARTSGAPHARARARAWRAKRAAPLDERVRAWSVAARHLHARVDCMHACNVVSCMVHRTTHSRLEQSLKMQGNDFLSSKIDVRTFEGLHVCVFGEMRIPQVFGSDSASFFLAGKIRPGPEN